MARTRARPVRLAAALLLPALVGVSCGSGDDRQQVTVLAASSLTDVLDDLETAFEAEHPDADLVVSTGGSPTLAAQAADGAPVAALITADRASMQRAVDAGVVEGEPEPIATNTVTVAAPTGPDEVVVGSIEDLVDDDLVVALCAPEVPCGRAADELLEAAGVPVEADTLELSVRGVVSRLELGEVDAGVVYRTDVSGSAGGLRAVPDDVADGVGEVGYLAAALDGEPGGGALVDFLRRAPAQQILADHGFGPP